MNRYVIDGALSDAAKGKQVILIADRHDLAAVLAAAVYTNPDRINRTVGAQRVTYASGGSLRLFAGRLDSLRGHQPDVLVAPIWWFDGVEPGEVGALTMRAEIVRY